QLLSSSSTSNTLLLHPFPTRRSSDLHSTMSNSGGLLVHKASHHFDLVNWWTDAIPESVFASGRLAYYGKRNACARGDHALTIYRSEEHTSELQSRENLVCRLLLEKKK